jgi:hypothetical protein
MSVLSSWTSASSYCSDIFAPYDYYNKQCFCKVPTVECSGGQSPGATKCTSGDVWKCSSSGVWEPEESCDYECSSGECLDEQCDSHEEKRCSSNSVYWYDSCGDKEEEYERCESDENCVGDQCVKFCSEGAIGGKLCSSNSIVQQYRLSDCSTETRVIETCQNGCDNSVCISPQCSTCVEPSSWSQCASGSMFRNNYVCSSSTNYECSMTTETATCECSSPGQCDYNEECNDNVCEALICSENSIADNHVCIEKSSISVYTIVIISTIGVAVLIILIGVFIVLKGGQNKNNGEKK